MQWTETDLGRIRWRCCRRGMLELDVILGGFFENHFLNLTQEEQTLFVQLLEKPDPVLFDWVLGHADPDDTEALALMNKIRA